MDIEKFLACERCSSQGVIYEDIPETGNTRVRSCPDCWNRRMFVTRMKHSGLMDSLERYTFDTFTTAEPYQQRMLASAKAFVENGASEGKWIFFGGQPGCGKTHLATAIIGKLLREYDCLYVVWTATIQKIKVDITDPERYDEQVSRLQDIDVLFIDDFFKPVKGPKGEIQGASAADIRIAFDILNHRYLNNKTTIISSEWFITELMDVDEAVASRIYEKCGEYKISIKREVSRNYRVQKDKADGAVGW